MEAIAPKTAVLSFEKVFCSRQSQGKVLCHGKGSIPVHLLERTAEGKALLQETSSCETLSISK